MRRLREGGVSGYPLLWQWDGEVMTPRAAFVPEANRQFVVGAIYRLGEIEERSDVSHRHEFAWLREAWKNLPEGLAADFPTPEHLRKRALIEAGYYHEQILDVGSNPAALRVAMAFRGRDDFAHVVVRGGVVVIREAKSQSRRQMDKAEFQASKTAIMEIIAAMIEVTPDQLAENAGKAA